MNGELSATGRLSAKLIKARKAPLSWRLKNTLRFAYLWAWLAEYAAKAFTAIFGVTTITARLEARLVRADGSVINYGIISRRYVTQNGVGHIIDDWQDGSGNINNFKYHACGTTNTAENQTDTALAAEATSITDRATGTNTQPAYNQLQSVGTQAFTNTGAIVEHGLFSVVTESTGVLWDRSVFTTINVGNGDSIQWTYTATINAGG